jgi:hypothetical protein
MFNIRTCFRSGTTQSTLSYYQKTLQKATKVLEIELAKDSVSSKLVQNDEWLYALNLAFVLLLVLFRSGSQPVEPVKIAPAWLWFCGVAPRT